VNKTKLHFKQLLTNHGYTTKTADELWNWYDPTEKKGAAST